MRKVMLLLCVVSGAVACGSEAGGGDPERFLGTWTYTEGLMQATCGGQRLSHDLTNTELAITRGPGDSLTVETSSCTLRFDLHGLRATAPAGQSCALTVNTIAATGHLARWTLDASDLPTLASAGEGTAELTTRAATEPFPCERFETTGLLTRVGLMEAP